MADKQPGLILIPFASSLSSEKQNRRHTEEFAAEIAQATGLDVRVGIAADLGTPGDALPAVLALTGGIEGDVLRALENTSGPVILLTHSEANSLPASLEILARLQQLGRQGLILRRADWAKRLPGLAHLWAAASQLHSTRLGVIGEPSDWLVASPVSPESLRNTWGIEAVNVPIQELIAEFDAVTLGEADTAAVTAGAEGIREPGEKEYGDSARVYLALRRIIDRYKLTAVAVRCFDLVTERGATGCYALSRLNEEGVVAACEGDVPSAISMLVLSALTGKPAFMANPADIDPDTNSLLFAHCTIARSLTTSFTLRSHFESGLGVAIQGTLPNGPVTVMRVGGVNLNHVMLAGGDLTGSSAQEGLCRTQVRIKLDGYPVTRLLTRPLGNHHTIGMGDVSHVVHDYIHLFAPEVFVLP